VSRMAFHPLQLLHEMRWCRRLIQISWSMPCRGHDLYGQAVVPPAALSNVVEIASRFSTNVALRKDGTVVCWCASWLNALHAGLATCKQGMSFNVVALTVASVSAAGTSMFRVQCPALLSTVGLLLFKADTLQALCASRAPELALALQGRRSGWPGYPSRFSAAWRSGGRICHCIVNPSVLCATQQWQRGCLGQS
jgi:hypothetical protein